MPEKRRPITPRLLLVLFTSYLILTASSCSPAARQKAATIATAAASGAAGASSPPRIAKLMIFGGMDHKGYLGCLNCNEYATDSVFNSYGPNGSSYTSESIWNHYSEFGSPYSMYSACNLYASDPPVIVDRDGHFYGRLTVNIYHAQIGIGAKYVDWLKGRVCS